MAKAKTKAITSKSASGVEAVGLPPMTEAELRQLLQHTVLKKDQVMPGREQLIKLAENLDGCKRLYFLAAQTWAPWSARVVAARQAALVLLRFLPHMAADIQKALDDPELVGGVLDEMMVRDLGRVKAAQSALDALMNMLIPVTAFAASIEKWEQLAPLIADFFRRAMHPNNPHTRLGLSNDGPVPRFVAAVLPYVTGDAPTVESVGQSLKRQARVKRDKAKAALSRGQTRARIVPDAAP